MKLEGDLGRGAASSPLSSNSKWHGNPGPGNPRSPPHPRGPSVPETASSSIGRRLVPSFLSPPAISFSMCSQAHMQHDTRHLSRPFSRSTGLASVALSSSLNACRVALAVHRPRRLRGLRGQRQHRQQPAVFQGRPCRRRLLRLEQPSADDAHAIGSRTERHMPLTPPPYVCRCGKGRSGPCTVPPPKHNPLAGPCHTALRHAVPF